MYVVTGKKVGHSFRIVAPTLKRANSIADSKIEEGYKGVKIEVYTGQLSLF